MNQPRPEHLPSRVEAAPGLVIERHRASIPPPVEVGDRTITLVRVDPERYQPRLLTARSDGGPRPLTRWVEDFQLTGGINASMFHADHRSTGLMIRRGKVNNGRDNPAFGGFLAFDPLEAAFPLLRADGRGCKGFDLGQTRFRYATVVQNYRMLDCEGEAIPWADRKAYSITAIGTDRRGWLVLLHVRTPYRVTVLNRMIAGPELGLRTMMYVEGGPEASLLVRAGEQQVMEVGSWETEFHERDDNHEFWPIPNIIGFAPRGP